MLHCTNDLKIIPATFLRMSYVVRTTCLKYMIHINIADTPSQCHRDATFPSPSESSESLELGGRLPKGLTLTSESSRGEAVPGQVAAPDPGRVAVGCRLR